MWFRSLSEALTLQTVPAHLTIDVMIRLASDQELSALLRKGLTAIDELNDEETFRFQSLLYAFFESCEMSFSQKQRGLLAKEDWMKWEAIIAMYMVQPGSQGFWKQSAMNFSPSFQDYINGVVPGSTYDFGQPKGGA